MSRDTCKRNCCWTPFSVCALKHVCDCHMNPSTDRINNLRNWYQLETFRAEAKANNHGGLKP